MKKMKKWRKTVFITVTIIIILRISYIAFRGEIDKEYVVSPQYDLSSASTVPCLNLSQTFRSSMDRLNSLEIAFANLADDQTGAVICCIYHAEELIYQTSISLSGIRNQEWKTIYVNAELLPNQEYKITLTANELCTQVPEVFIVEDYDASESILSFREGNEINGQIAIQYGCLRDPGLTDRLAVISLWMLLWFFVFAVLYCFEIIWEEILRGVYLLLGQAQPHILRHVLELAACSIIVNCGGIEFQEPTKIIMYLISFVSLININKKKEYIDRLIDHDWKKAAIYLLYAYAAFALTGQRIFIYPLTKKLSATGLFVYACTVFWFIPVIQSMFYYLEAACRNSFQKNTGIKTWKFISICILLLLMPAAYHLYANNPGISSYDTGTTMIVNAQHLHGMYDWHPAFYCMVLRAIQKVWNSTYAVIMVQYFFWAYVVTELLVYLRKKGIREPILIITALFTGLNAGNFVQLNTIWKDIPYTLSLLWALILTAKLSIDGREYKGKWYIYLELTVSLVGLFFYRKNGIVPFIIIIFPLAVVLRKNRKLLFSLTMSVVMVFLIKGPVYGYFEIQDPGRYGIYIGLSQDILGVYYAGGEVSESTLQMINVMTDYNNAEYSYTPTWSYQSYDLDVSVKKFIWNYMDTFIKNPVLMTRAVISREDALWNIFAGQDAVLKCVNYTKTLDENSAFCWNDYYPPRKYVSLYPGMAAATAYTASSQWISALEWRSGLFTLLGLSALVFLLIRNGIGTWFLIVTPLLGQIISLLLSTGWSDFRYFWPMNLLNMAVILLVPVAGKQDCSRTTPASRSNTRQQTGKAVNVQN